MEQIAGLQTYSWWLLRSWSVEIVEWSPTPLKWLVGDQPTIWGPFVCQRDTQGVIGTQCAVTYFMRLGVLVRLTSLLYVILYEATKGKKTTDYRKILLHEIKMTVACHLVYLVIDVLFWP